MKYLKYFENIGKLSVGDYVLIRDDEYKFTSNFNIFLKTHIGKVTHIIYDTFYVDFILDELNEFPNEWYKNQMFHMEHLEFSSKNKNDIEMFIKTRDYNL